MNNLIGAIWTLALVLALGLMAQAALKEFRQARSKIKKAQALPEENVDGMVRETYARWLDVLQAAAWSFYVHNGRTPKSYWELARWLREQSKQEVDDA